MSALAITTPWTRTSPLYIPRRDLVSDASDSLTLTVTLLESDDPDAVAADLITGPTFPQFTLTIWRLRPDYRMWDYGAGALAIDTRSILWLDYGVIDAIVPGTVSFVLPLGTMSGWPERCGWAVRVAHDTILQDTIMLGTLHLRGVSSLASSDFQLNTSNLG